MKNSKTKIEFDYSGKHYVLEFTADSIKKMEKAGYDFSSIDKKICTSTEDAFCGLFIAHHADTPMKLRKEIFGSLSRHSEDDNAEEEEDGLASVIAEMLLEAFDEIGGRSGNVDWKIVR